MVVKRGALKLKLQLMCGEICALGPGKADLLAAIAQAGSISGAARALGMSYRRAWLLVDEMNRCFTERLVIASPGRGAGSGARLTQVGEKMLHAYRELDAAASAIVETSAYGLLVAALRTTHTN